VTLTKRGKRVRAIAILIGIYLIYQIIGNVWWVGVGAPTEDFMGYCFDSMADCVVL
jgi:hypothetical protein